MPDPTDIAYLDAVAAGDLRTACSILHAAAKAAGYQGPFWHGGTVQDKFRDDPEAKAHYVSEEIDAAATYAAQYPPGEGTIKPIYLKLNSTLDLTEPEAFRKWVGEPREQFSTPGYRMLADGFGSGAPILDRIREMGYDSVRFYDTDASNRGCAPSIAFFNADAARMGPRDFEIIHGPAYWDYTIEDGTVMMSPTGQVIPPSLRLAPGNHGLAGQQDVGFPAMNPGLVPEEIPQGPIFTR